MFFDPVPHNVSQEILLSRKKKVSIHPVINLNNIQVEKAFYQKHRDCKFLSCHVRVSE